MTDAFDRLWTPHRLAYVTGQARKEGCPFCDIGDDLVVHRGETSYAVLNLYPYNPGHLLLVPYRHVADYCELTAGESAEIAALTATAIRTLREVSSPQGFNVGLNLGDVAGAGIAAHLHQHVVPRWGGDTNFMAVTGRTRVLPQLLTETRALLAGAWST